VKKIEKLAAGKLQIEVDCSRKKKIRNILRKAFPDDYHGLRFIKSPFHTVFWIARCEIHDHMWVWITSPRLNVKSIKLSEYGVKKN